MLRYRLINRKEDTCINFIVPVDTKTDQQPLLVDSRISAYIEFRDFLGLRKFTN